MQLYTTSRFFYHERTFVQSEKMNVMRAYNVTENCFTAY